MKPLSAMNRELPVPSNQPGLRSPDQVPSEVESSTAPIDRKAKKRIQNRVAQRTYRTRIKQRLHDLQQQVHTLQQKEEEQLRESQREIKSDDSGNEETIYYTPISESLAPTFVYGQSEEQNSPEVRCQDFHDIKTTSPGPWDGIPSQPHMWSPPQGTRFMYGNSFNMTGRPPLATMPDLSPTSLPLDTAGSILSPHTCGGEHLQSTLAFSPGVEDNPRHRIANQANDVFGTNEGRRVGQFQGFNSTHLSPWLDKLEPWLTADDPTPVAAARHPASIHQPFYQDGIMSAPMTTAPTQWPENISPNTHASLEEQFEYVLSCAQRAGFDSFDTMALHYYTRNFNPVSTIALEQHLSRDRRLPELLAELRKQSTNWSEWQRRGYQGETLKAAEEICTMEYDEFRKCEGNGREYEVVDEAVLGDMLPNLWALLTGLVSSNQQLSQRQTSEVVMRCMRLLCGLEGLQNQAVTPSGPSPR
ncbi:hypothetical protein F5B21DRAFT_224027 [Xylaria acuta]|nr:hypothetical protein F5B21DRAFT_224027 [Xylaria acuta]